MAPPQPSLSEVLPPLILGTATFNTQHHPDPQSMPYTAIVRRALQHGITAFDTSPYYGPSEQLLGEALRNLTPPLTRDQYFLITKAGRVGDTYFDYTPNWIRISVHRSLEHLNTSYLDLVYAHDVEFVTMDEVVAAVKELRRLRVKGQVRYIGISGYPVDVLASLAAVILQKTGEPLDAVLSYSHFCVQNSRLGQPDLLARFRDARVGCVLNASMLSMGLLTTRGVYDGIMASWHPAPPALRKACKELATLAKQSGEHLEEVALRWAIEGWSRIGASFGTRVRPVGVRPNTADGLPDRVGVSVMGVTSVEELEETWALWKSVMRLAGDREEAAAERSARIDALVVDQMWPSLGEWKDYAWESGTAPPSDAIITQSDGVTQHGPEG